MRLPECSMSARESGREEPKPEPHPQNDVVLGINDFSPATPRLVAKLVPCELYLEPPGRRMGLKHLRANRAETVLICGRDRVDSADVFKTTSLFVIREDKMLTLKRPHILAAALPTERRIS
jgi:hypothetical protein